MQQKKQREREGRKRYFVVFCVYVCVCFYFNERRIKTLNFYNECNQFVCVGFTFTLPTGHRECQLHRFVSASSVFAAIVIMYGVCESLGRAIFTARRVPTSCVPWLHWWPQESEAHLCVMQKLPMLSTEQSAAHSAAVLQESL